MSLRQQHEALAVSNPVNELAYLHCVTRFKVSAIPRQQTTDIPLLLMVEPCRRKLVSRVSDPKVRLFWTMYNAMKPAEQQDHAESTLNKLDEFLSPLLLTIVGQAKTTMNFRSVMDERKILLVRLDPRLEDATTLIGSMLI